MTDLRSEARAIYALLRERMDELPPAAGEDRQVIWADPGRRVGIARGRLGHLEIFLPGPPLTTVSREIGPNLRHNTWQSADGELLANRLLLPTAAHFDSVAAFLCSALVENGVLGDLADGFRRTEPVIEMAMERIELQDSAFVGLCGELRILVALIDNAPRSRLREVVDGWYGHVHSSRDFQIGSAGIEVKTTTKRTSTHRIHGVAQAEPGHPVHGGYESTLILTSVGLERADGEVVQGTWSLPDVVSELVERCIRVSDVHPDLEAELLEKIRRYGDDDGMGYDHANPDHRVSFAQPWRVRFVRWYDMSDRDLHALRSPDLAPFPEVDRSTIHYDLALPDSVRGDLNPWVGLGEGAKRFVDLAWNDPA